MHTRDLTMAAAGQASGLARSVTDIIERHLQRCLNKLQEWADANGFKFSTSKTVCMHVCHLRKHHLDPELFLYGTPIPVLQEVKFLGLIFDSKLCFLPHIRYLKNNSTKALSLIRVVAHTSSGTDQDTLLLLYTSLIMFMSYDQINNVMRLRQDHWMFCFFGYQRSMLQPSANTDCTIRHHHWVKLVKCTASVGLIH